MAPQLEAMKSSNVVLCNSTFISNFKTLFLTEFFILVTADHNDVHVPSKN